MRKVLVTGGAGFLGSHLCERLLKLGNHVICLDNLYTGSIGNIKHLFSDSKFEFLNHDVVEPISLDVDQIYNLACPASPCHYQKDPIKTTKTNFMGVLNLLELAKKNNASLLQASTSEIYGEPIVHPQPEKYWGNVNPIGVRACYDEGKRIAESLMFDFHRQYGVEIKIVRIFNTYGPRMNPDDGRVVSNFIVQAIKGEDITVYGDGSQTRSFCYVDDLVNGLCRMMDKTNFNGPVNLGNPEEYSINELAKKIIELTNSKSKIVYKSLPSDDPTQRKPVIDLAKKTLNWQPKITLDEGLRRMITYYKTIL